MPDKIDCIYLARSPTSQLFVHGQGAVLLAVPKDWKVRSVMCCHRQVALFAHVRSPMPDNSNCIYLARSSASQLFVHDQGVESKEVSFR